MGRKTNLGSQGVNARGGSVPFVSRIRFHKTVYILLITLLLTIALLLTILPAAKSAYSEQGCSNMQTSIKIIDESGGKRLNTIPTISESKGITLATLVDSPFKRYATAVSEHIVTKINEMPQHQGNLQSRPEVKLCFVYSPLVTSEVTPLYLRWVRWVSSRRPAMSDDISHLDSPWVKLTISRSPKSVVQAVFIWSERQILFDQALMAGASNEPNEPLLPFNGFSFERFIQDYTNSVLLSASPEAQSAAQASISKRLPPEIFWLFRHAWQSTLAPFSMEVDRALRTTIQRAEGGYTELTKVLIDQVLTSTKTEIRYESILDLKNVFTLDQYQITQVR